jgi:hypothetical protein
MNQSYSRDEAEKIARRLIRKKIITKYNNLNEGNQCQIWVGDNRIAGGHNWRQAIIELCDIVKEFYI